MTWEEAVCWLREQPEQRELIESCYYDDPLAEAALRFERSEEWQAVKELIPETGSVLDMGAGRGISSVAFARAGWKTTALEPDESSIVGAGAIRELADVLGVDVEIANTWGESLPFEKETFDLVYGRAVFHHARDLNEFCAEACRVLKPGGQFMMTREHVLSDRGDLETFLNSHPLHKLYGGEAAYLLSEYSGAIEAAGMVVEEVIGPKSNPINYFPQTKADLAEALRRRLQKQRGKIGGTLASLVPGIRKRELAKWEGKMKLPGRLYSFVARKAL